MVKVRKKSEQMMWRYSLVENKKILEYMYIYEYYQETRKIFSCHFHEEKPHEAMLMYKTSTKKKFIREMFLSLPRTKVQGYLKKKDKIKRGIKISRSYPLSSITNNIIYFSKQ